MEVVPENGNILCEPVDSKIEKVESEYGFVYEEECLPTYRIVSGEYAGFRPGDLVVCDSTGTRLNMGGGKIFYLFPPENLAFRIIQK